MSEHVYFPQDLVRQIAPGLVLVGYKINRVYIGIKFVDQSLVPRVNTIPELPGLMIIGSTDGDLGRFKIEKHPKKVPILIPRTNEEEIKYTIILFKPPNFQNLEYFSINPILLQSMGNHEPCASTAYYYKAFGTTDYESSILNEQILDKINAVTKIRIQLDTKLEVRKPQARKLPITWRKMISKIILVIEIVLIKLMNIINFRLINLVKMSELFRQLDLRLKQIIYFPIQFLCYYDKNILYKENSILLKELGLWEFNSSLNINNSNYINLYNSLWLIINDVLIGITLWKLIDSHYDELSLSTINKIQMMIDELFKLINWISFNPGGFKLNNELSKFIGDLFLWTLQNWRTITHYSSIILVKYKYQCKIILKLLCYMGSTFLLSLIIDLINLLTLNIYWFYKISCKIYEKQLQIIKSLVQLFQGKKYNVLRQRIDHLYNFSKPNEFEIDHLLLGTLIFIILILLIPTILAYYITFFILRLSLLIIQNFLENLIIIINFAPIFVLLLKFKNSNRLQGGININTLPIDLNNNYLQLTNKSLTYSEIFKNFRLIFRKFKNFRKSLFNSFFMGNLIDLNHDYDLKFNYLMLPENFDKIIDIWDSFTNKND